MKRTSLVLSMVLILGLIVGGCGSAVEAPATGQSDVSTEQSVSEQSGDNIYRWNFALPADRIGVPLNVLRYNQVYHGISVETLIDASNDEAGVYMPRLATEWELAEDRLSYTWKLREGVTFHDGSEFNAEVAKWNLEQWLAGGTPLLAAIESIDIIDDYTIRTNLSAWDSLLLADFARVSRMISKEAFEANGEEWANDNPIGTGAWKLVEFQPKQLLRFEAFEDYWREGHPKMAGLEIEQVPDPVTAIAMLQSGDVQALYQVDSVTAGELQATGDYEFSIFPGPHFVIVMNLVDEDSVWSDVRMRQALEYAIDKESITAALGNGFVDPHYEVIHSLRTAGGNPDTTPRTYDPDKARELMAEAGYPDGVDGIVATVGSRQNQSFFLAIQANLAEVGINMEINPVDDVALNQLSLEPPAGSDVLITTQRGGPLNPLGSTNETLAENTIYFPGIPRPEGFSDLLAQALQEPDPAEQMSLLEEMEKLLYDDVMLVKLWNLPIVSVDDGSVSDMNWTFGGTPSPRFEWASFSE